MPSAPAKSPLVKTTIDSRIAHSRLRASRMAHSSSIRSTHDNVRRQHASRLPSASTPPATRSASKTNVAAQAHANCCRRPAEDGFLAQTEAAASAQHVDGLSPLLRWGPGQRMRAGPPRLSATVGHADLTFCNEKRQIRSASHLERRAVGVVRPLAACPLTLVARRGTLKTALQSRKNCSRCVVRRSQFFSDPIAPRGDQHLHEGRAAFWCTTRRLLFLHSSWQHRRPLTQACMRCPSPVPACFMC